MDADDDKDEWTEAAIGLYISAYDNVRSPDIFRSNVMHVREKACLTGHLDWS